MTEKLTSNTLSDLNELNLDNIEIPDSTDDIIFPDELNRVLRDKIQNLSYENGMLRKNLMENENTLEQNQSQISLLNNQLEKYTNASSYTLAGDMATSKIVELSKKLREKNSELETYKTRCSRLERHIYELENTQNNRANDIDIVPVKEKPKDILEEELKKSQDKLASTSSRLFDALNLNKQLKTDLKVANKLVQQEIGETLEKLQSNTVGFRGRAQIICDLQQKNNELKEKIKMLSEKLDKKGEEILKTKADKRTENILKENQALKNEVMELRKKLDAFKARTRVLEVETAVSKARQQGLVDNNERDQQLINTLTAQLSNLQNSHNDFTRQKQGSLIKLERENKGLSLDLARETLRADNLEKEVQFCRQEMEKLSSNSLQRNASRLSTEFNNDAELSANSSYLEVERQRLLELIEVCNRRLEKERQQHSQLQLQHRAEKQKAAKLEAKFARFKLEHHSERSSVYSNSSILTSRSNKEQDNVLENKLELAEEQIKALETRLDIERKERQLDFAEFSKILQNYNSE